jgi:hypothetical protein
MRSKVRLPASLTLFVACVVFAINAVAAPAKDFKFEGQLIWATMSDTSPDPAHEPVDDETRKQLSQLPLKWKNYFLVKKVRFSVSEKGSKEVSLSDKCKISVKDLDGKSFEVALVGKGEPVLKRTQKLPKNESLVLGGNAPDSTGWLVLLKRIE